MSFSLTENEGLRFGDRSIYVYESPVGGVIQTEDLPFLMTPSLENRIINSSRGYSMGYHAF